MVQVPASLLDIKRRGRRFQLGFPWRLDGLEELLLAGQTVAVVAAQGRKLAERDRQVTGDRRL